MKADDREAPPDGERIDGTGERLLELPKLVVDMHPQRLKRTRCGVFARLPRPDGTRHQLRKLAGALERPLTPRRHDGLRHPAREALFSQSGDHLANLVDARTSEPCGHRLTTCRVHAHIERTVGPEAEAARRIVELR